METKLDEIVTDPVHEASCLKCRHVLDVSGLPAFTEIACPECGNHQKVPAKMGAFLLVDLLGRGGMGAVYRGRDTGLDRWVAVKVMQSSFGGNPEFVETFRREAQAAAALTHPNIVQIYSFGVAHGQPYMAMELLEGGRLDQMISKGEMLNEALVLKIGADVAEGLNAAAGIGLIHGDVKPENILLDNNGVAKVVDFGLARFKEGGESGTSKGIWGTPYYIAPEKLRGHQSDARSDIYSLGGTLFHALTLKPPFEGVTPMDVVKARLKKPAPPVRTYRPNINREIESIVGRMLEADPSVRYPNYGSALADLRRVLATMAPPDIPLSYAQPSKRSGKIILAKKKGLTIPSPANASGSLPKVGAGALPPAGPKKKSGGMKVFWIILAVLALVGILIGVVVHQKEVTRQDEEKATIAKYRKQAGKIWDDFQPLLADISNRTALAQSWKTQAVNVVSMLTTGIPSLPDAGAFPGALSNASAYAAAITKYSTGVLAAATTEMDAIVSQLHSNYPTINNSSNATLIHTRLMAITNVVARSTEVVTPLSEKTDQARKALDSLADLKVKFEKALKAAQDVAAQAALERAAAEKAAAEQRAAEQAAAAKEASIKGEIEAVATGRKALGTLVQQHQFAEAAASIEQVVKTLQTEEGKAAGRLAVKAYGMLVDLKATILEGIKEDVKNNPDGGYQFGWLGKRDILGADDTKIAYRGGEAAWSAVPPQQMMRFIQRYVETAPMSKRMKARHNFAIALYITDSTGGNEKFRPAAAKYLTEAIRADSELEDLAKTLMPEVK